MTSERRRLVSSIFASTSATLKKLRFSGEVIGEVGAVLESPNEPKEAEGNRDWVNCLKSCRLRRDSGRREVEGEGWSGDEVSVEKDLTRFFRCRCLTEEEEAPSLGSASEERDLTRLRNGLSLVGKLRDFDGDEVVTFCPSLRDTVGEECLELVGSPGD